jgi:hypothetical protein
MASRQPPGTCENLQKILQFSIFSRESFFIHMNLNFVSSAVLSSTDGVSHNEERPIESKEAISLRKNATSWKPLFEQIQYNRDREREQYEEISKAMRGTRTLDDEDCAHLDSVSAVRMERERRIQQSVEEELAEFKAARELLYQSTSTHTSIMSEVNTTSNSEHDHLSNNPLIPTQQKNERNSENKQHMALQPPILVRKRRRRNTDVAPTNDAKPAKKFSSPKSVEEPSTGVALSDNNTIGLCALLGVYGSDDEDD